MITKGQQQIIKQAVSILENSFKRSSTTLNESHAVKQYCRLLAAPYEREVFGIIYLNTVHAFIDSEILFYGTIDSAYISPREVVKGALMKNASAAIAFHNHPSGTTRPSRSDLDITDILKKALSVIDVNLIDHIIVTHSDSFSFAETGKM